MRRPGLRTQFVPVLHYATKASLTRHSRPFDQVVNHTRPPGAAGPVIGGGRPMTVMIMGSRTAQRTSSKARQGDPLGMFFSPLLSMTGSSTLLRRTVTTSTSSARHGTPGTDQVKVTGSSPSSLTAQAENTRGARALVRHGPGCSSVTGTPVTGSRGRGLIGFGLNGWVGRTGSAPGRPRRWRTRTGPCKAGPNPILDKRGEED